MAPTSPGTRPAGMLRRGVDWLLRDRTTGRIVLAQWPNPPLGIYLVAVCIRRFADPSGSARALVDAVAVVSILWWGVDEVARGVNPFRRILGGTVIAATLAGAFLR